MASIFTQEVGVQTWMLIVVAIILLAIICITIWLTVSVRDIQKPKFGFGGKPLAMITVVLLTLLIPAGIYVTKQRVDTIQHAAELNDLTISVFEISDLGTESEVALSGVPIQEGKAWDEGALFDFEWAITGAENIAFSEEDRTAAYPSYFVMNLDKGDYTATLRVTTDGFDITRAKEFTVD